MIKNNDFNKKRDEHRRFIKCVLKKYLSVLSEDMLTACGDIALWRCMKSYDESYGQSFSSSLYRFIRWECLRMIGEQKPRHITGIHPEVESRDNSIENKLLLEDCLSILSSKERRMVEARYLYGMTLREIASREGYSDQGVKNIIDRCISAMGKIAVSV